MPRRGAEPRRPGQAGRRALLGLLAGAGVALPVARAQDGAALRERLSVPRDYRTRFTFLGSFAVSATNGPGAKELHTVYASPGAVEAFRAAGRFADGAVLVKEVTLTEPAVLTTGRVDMAGRLLGWFVMVKDGRGAVANDPLWGEGWGWAWFDVGDPARTTTQDWRAACQTCHLPVRASDWLHIGAYPLLR